MKITYIFTADGKTKVEWWGQERFRNRESRIYTAGTVHVIPIPDTLILCDFCNAEITEFPVPVLWGSHALCGECLTNVQRRSNDN